jgi:glycosyltransferase involved in cell wall biosynthesis
MLSAYPEADVYTSLYDKSTTFPEFQKATIQVSPLNRSKVLQRRHRLALPLLAPVFSGTRVDSEVTICSSSGWAHGVHTSGRKIVYCYAPARWLYQKSQYLGPEATIAPRLALGVLSPALRRWDRRAANGADRYLTSSTAVSRRIKNLYGQDAEILPPPPRVNLEHPRCALESLDAGFWLCVARLLPYKNVDAVIAAFAELPDEELVVAGTGPQEAKLRSAAGVNVRMTGQVSDDELCWLYANCRGVVSASYEDFGLTPLEAAVFGKPAVVHAWGGFLDTVEEDVNGVFFYEPEPRAVAKGIQAAIARKWNPKAIQTYAEAFDEEHFRGRLRSIVMEEVSLALAGS